MPFRIIRNDLVRTPADAIISTANPRPIVGRGTETSVYRAAGWDKLLEARKKIGDLAIGEAAASPAFDLPARYVIHTAAPRWYGGDEEVEILRRCYRSSLKLCAELGCKSAAFPLIASGTYRFPKGTALRIAVDEIMSFLMENDMQVTIAVLDEASLGFSEKLVGDIERIIDDIDAGRVLKDEYGAEYPKIFACEAAEPEPSKGVEWHISGRSSPALRNACAAEESTMSRDMRKAYSTRRKEAPAIIIGETFYDILHRYAEESGRTNKDIYECACMDRKLFSKLWTNPDYHPKKETVEALMLALHLNTEQAEEFMAAAGYAFAPGNKTDAIVRYFINIGESNLWTVNLWLSKYGLNELGSF